MKITDSDLGPVGGSFVILVVDHCIADKYFASHVTVVSLQYFYAIIFKRLLSHFLNLFNKSSNVYYSSLNQSYNYQYSYEFFPPIWAITHVAIVF